MIPSVIDRDTQSPGEFQIYEALENDPATEKWVVLHSLDTVKRTDRIAGEIDFLVVVPGKGILVVEVKAHHFIDRRDGRWFMGRSDRVGDSRGPFKQASSAMHSLKKDIQNRFPGLRSVPFGTCVIFTHCDFRQSSPEWNDWEIIDSSKLLRPLGGLLSNVLDKWREKYAAAASGAWFDPEADEPSEEQVKVLVNYLRPNFEVYESPESRAKRRNESVKRFTEKQYAAIDAMTRNKRVIFEGPAGTGKTMLAIECARRGAVAGRRVLFLCFNRLLGDWLSAETQTLRPFVKTLTFHRYLRELVPESDVFDFDNPDFWKETLPSNAAERLLVLDMEDGYDEVVVDEMQDLLRPNYLDILDLSLKGGLEHGRWRFFGDFEKQSIYKDATMSLDTALESALTGSVPYSLRDNCRNGPHVVELAYQLAGLNPKYDRVLRENDGNKPRTHYYRSESEQQRLLDEELSLLKQEGFLLGDIVVLSPRTNCVATRLTSSPWKQKMDPAERKRENRIRYSTIHAFKGLEAGAVIVTDLTPDDVSSDLFYIAITRTLHRLTLLITEEARQAVTEIITRNLSVRPATP